MSSRAGKDQEELNEFSKFTSRTFSKNFRHLSRKEVVDWDKETLESTTPSLTKLHHLDLYHTRQATARAGAHKAGVVVQQDQALLQLAHVTEAATEAMGLVISS